MLLEFRMLRSKGADIFHVKFISRHTKWQRQWPDLIRDRSKQEATISCISFLVERVVYITPQGIPSYLTLVCRSRGQNCEKEKDRLSRNIASTINGHFRKRSIAFDTSRKRLCCPKVCIPSH